MGAAMAAHTLRFVSSSTITEIILLPKKAHL